MVNPADTCWDAGGRVTESAGRKTCIQFQRIKSPIPPGETAAGITGAQLPRDRLRLENPHLQGFFADACRGMRPHGRTGILPFLLLAALVPALTRHIFSRSGRRGDRGEITRRGGVSIFQQQRKHHNPQQQQGKAQG